MWRDRSTVRQWSWQNVHETVARARFHIKISKNWRERSTFGTWRRPNFFIHWFIGSVIHWFIDSLTESLNLWFIDSLSCWFTDSSTHWFTACLIHWVIASLTHWFIDWPIHWFIGSWIHWFTGSFTHLCADSFMSFHWHLNNHLLIRWCTSRLQHFNASASQKLSYRPFISYSHVLFSKLPPWHGQAGHYWYHTLSCCWW